MQAVTKSRGMTTRWALVALLSLSGVAAMAAAAGRAAPDNASSALRRRIPEVKFDGVSFADALTFLRDVGNLNLQIDWPTLEAAGVDRSTPVTFYLRNISVEKALSTLLREVGGGAKITYEVNEGVVDVTTQDEADKHLTTEVYDIRDLMFAPLDAGDPPEVQFQLEAVTRGGGGGSGSNLFGGNSGSGAQRPARTPEDKGADIVQLVETLIRPDVWQANGGPASIRYFNGNLIVSAPRSVHELIGTPVR